MAWRVVSWAVGVALLVAASIVLVQQVTVRAGSTETLCGSSFDVVAGRVGWRDWWALDVAETSVASSPAFVRSRQCPQAVNARMLVAGGLALVAVTEIAAFEVIRARRTQHAVLPPRSAANRFRRLGVAVTAAGAALAIAGATALVLLVADPRSTLFLYVDRPVAVLFGLLLLEPAVAMILVGRALSLAAVVRVESRDDEAA